MRHGGPDMSEQRRAAGSTQNGKKSRGTSEAFDSETIAPQPKCRAVVHDNTMNGVHVDEEETLENGDDGTAATFPVSTLPAVGSPSSAAAFLALAPSSSRYNPRWVLALFTRRTVNPDAAQVWAEREIPRYAVPINCLTVCLNQGP
ncbi:hypothetical protein NL676_004765 [Syzygium grande]|nr:hypothetical protein NL676_004765 [Syzygium grande]